MTTWAYFNFTDEETYEQNNLPYSMYQLQTKLWTQVCLVICVNAATQCLKVSNKHSDPWLGKYHMAKWTHIFL